MSSAARPYNNSSARTVSVHPARVNSCERISGQRPGRELVLVDRRLAAVLPAPILAAVGLTQRGRWVESLVTAAPDGAGCQRAEWLRVDQELGDADAVGLRRVREPVLVRETQTGGGVSGTCAVESAPATLQGSTMVS